MAALSDPTYEAGGWRAIYALEQVDGRPVIASVRLEPQDLESSAPELSATLARELMRPGEALRMVREHLADPLTRALAQMFSPLRAMLEGYHDPRPRQGKRQPDYFYVAIASAYLQAVGSGSRSPVADVARALGNGYKPTLIREALARARNRGLLTRPPMPNKAGGELTELGREALEAGPGE